MTEQELKQRLMQTYNGALHIDEHPGEHVLLSDMIQYSRCEVLCPYEHSYFSLEVSLYLFDEGCLLFDWDHGSCWASDTTIRQMVKDRMDERNETIEQATRKVTEELVDSMTFFPTREAAIEYWNARTRDE